MAPTPVYGMIWWGRGSRQSGACVVVTDALHHASNDASQHAEYASRAVRRSTPLTCTLVYVFAGSFLVLVGMKNQ